MNDDIDLSTPRRTRRAKLDTRAPADYVPEQERVRIAAMYYLLRSKKKVKEPYWTITPLWKRYERELWFGPLLCRLSRTPMTLQDRFGVVYPRPEEVAPCCWSVRTSGQFKFAFMSHLRSAAHIAQHFRVDARSVVVEARLNAIADALNVEEDEKW